MLSNLGQGVDSNPGQQPLLDAKIELLIPPPKRSRGIATSSTFVLLHEVQYVVDI